MSNSYFQFKQFRIEQDRCAMKVSTDACIQGAWTPISSACRSVLDVGAGTGLLSLMLAQRNSSIAVDAIELDEGAATQAQENFRQSPWSNRLKIFQQDAREWDAPSIYDLIICNPPFFSKSLLGAKEQRNAARHDLSLTLQELFDLATRMLKPAGELCILLPYAEHQHWERLLLQHNWSICRELSVVPRAGQAANRIVSIASRLSEQAKVEEELIIRDSNNNYTAAFMQLMQPFYLNL